MDEPIDAWGFSTQSQIPSVASSVAAESVAASVIYNPLPDYNTHGAPSVQGSLYNTPLVGNAPQSTYHPDAMSMAASTTPRPDLSNQLSFDTPFAIRGPAFYEWRNEQIHKGNVLIEQLPTVHRNVLARAAKANRDEAEESSFKVSKRCEKFKAMYEKERADAEALRVAVLQLQTRVAELNRRVTPPPNHNNPFLQSMTTGNGGPYGNHPIRKIFSFKSNELPTYDGERNAEKVITFLVALERAFRTRAQETNSVGNTTAWGMYAVQQLRNKAAEWGNHVWGLGDEIEWESFKDRLTDQFIPIDYVTRLKLEMANLVINPKKPLLEFNEKFRSVRLRLRIVTRSRGTNDETDPSLIDFYISRIQTAAASEKGSDCMAKVYGAYVQWTNLQRHDSPPTLSVVMNFCARMDDIHNRHSGATLSVNLNSGGSSNQLTTSQGGDKMDLCLANARSNNQSSNNRGRNGYQGESKRRDNDRKGHKDDKSKKDDDKAKRDTSKMKCYHCDGIGHIKAECKGYKKMIGALERKAEARITEVEDSEGSDESEN
ncbi:hypothetical protein DFH27DRAFT_637299 [Peziza echinospora]|nr:hypothetical protein DFH27DRAFT_637299 [Peziza echinospora]